MYERIIARASGKNQIALINARFSRAIQWQQPSLLIRKLRASVGYLKALPFDVALRYGSGQCSHHRKLASIHYCMTNSSLEQRGLYAQISVVRQRACAAKLGYFVVYKDRAATCRFIIDERAKACAIRLGEPDLEYIN
jgi:hypothetical protein